jgi:hypothetical protein
VRAAGTEFEPGGWMLGRVVSAVGGIAGAGANRSDRGAVAGACMAPEGPAALGSRLDAGDVAGWLAPMTPMSPSIDDTPSAAAPIRER